MKVLTILEPKFNDIELTTPLSCIKRADENVLIDYFHPEFKKLTGQYNIVTIDNIKNKVNFDEYDLIFIPGGVGAQNLRTNKESLNLIKNTKTPIAAICDAPNVLRENNIISEELTYSSYPSEWSIKTWSTLRKNEYVTNNFKNNKIITAKCADAGMDLGLEIVKEFYGEKIYTKVVTAMKGIKEQ
ncbi:DJ-1/PfpI family protein [Mycoplasmopsis cricetuli]|uniref:DJ-1/PfpI family protein n=1 Tax=Mycoplasmopsis cricetuli TaxID=171283 RepID=UPI0004718C3E|nr:DJ-1/PfpI family protein [Mycoplasmopsis cricetuli]